MNNISLLKDCYGCGVCVVACPLHIISLRENNDGFYSPVIENMDKCIECHRCLDVCAFNHKELAHQSSPQEIFCYGAWSLNPKEQATSTSGGLGFEIVRYLVTHGYQAIVVRYNIEKHRAEHYIASTVSELVESKKSKYIPSYTVEGFSGIKKNGKYVIVGLPCQIDSIRRYINKLHISDNCLIIDLLCYGVPSHNSWTQYLRSIHSQTGRIHNVDFRYKGYGWHKSSCTKVEGEKGVVIEKENNPFYSLFFTNLCLNKCCYYSCKYKLLNSSADIRIGDFWGNAYKENEKGVNAVMTFTEKGFYILNELRKNNICHIEPRSLEELIPAQMKKCVPHFWGRSVLLYFLRKNINLKFVVFLAKIIVLFNNPMIVWKKIERK